MKYKLQGADETNGVLDTENGMSIPNATGNRHWSEYLQWKLGNDANGTPLAGTPGVQAPDSQYTLAELRTNKKLELKSACSADLESGFVSDALGTDYTYESTLKDQTNISGAAQAGITVDFTVIDGADNKLRVSHNTTQMNQVFSDGVAIMQTKKNTLYVLLGNVDSAADEAAVAAIVWA